MSEELPRKQVPLNEVQLSLVNHVVSNATDEQLIALRRWGEQLLAVRAMETSKLEQIKAAVQITHSNHILLPLLRIIGQSLKQHGWDKRGTTSRFALAGVLAGIILFGGQGAGIAAFGGAIGVPLWVVLGSGAAFVGVLVEEAKRKHDN